MRFGISVDFRVWGCLGFTQGIESFASCCRNLLCFGARGVCKAQAPRLLASVPERLKPKVGVAFRGRVIEFLGFIGFIGIIGFIGFIGVIGIIGV